MNGGSISALSNHCQILLAKLFHLLCDPENSRDWWFSLFHKDVTNLSQQKLFGSINYIPLNSLFEISNNDWILFLLDCKIVKRREQIILHLENLESFKLQNNLHFIHTKFYHRTYITFNKKIDFLATDQFKKELILQIW